MPLSIRLSIFPRMNQRLGLFCAGIATGALLYRSFHPTSEPLFSVRSFECNNLSKLFSLHPQKDYILSPTDFTHSSPSNSIHPSPTDIIHSSSDSTQTVSSGNRANFIADAVENVLDKVARFLTLGCKHCRARRLLALQLVELVC